MARETAGNVAQVRPPLTDGLAPLDGKVALHPRSVERLDGEVMRAWIQIHGRLRLCCAQSQGRLVASASIADIEAVPRKILQR